VGTMQHLMARFRVPHQIGYPLYGWGGEAVLKIKLVLRDPSGGAIHRHPSDSSCRADGALGKARRAS
jgi:hypothetical protein